MKKNGQSFRNPWDTIKYAKICITGVLEGKEKGAERILNKIMTKHSPNLMKTINLHVQEAQPTPSTINSKRSITRHIKQQFIIYKEASVRLTADFSSKTM